MSQHAPAAPIYNVDSLFSSGPQVVLPEEDVGELISTQTPSDDVALQTHVKESLKTLKRIQFKPCGVKVPPSAACAEFLKPTRKQFHDFIYYTLNLIVKQTKLVNRLSAHFANGTFPTEYRSIKMPNVCTSGHQLHVDFHAWKETAILNFKQAMLVKQLETERTFLTGLKIAMSQPVVAETYKTVAAQTYQRMTAVEYTEWSALAHILSDLDVIHKMTSREVNRKARIEQEKAERLQAAQANAATADASLPVRDLVKKVVKEEISALPKKPSQKPSSKNSSKKGPAPKNSGPKSNAAPKKKTASAKPVKRSSPKPSASGKKKSPPAKHLKESPPRGSKSTSSRKKNGGKN